MTNQTIYIIIAIFLVIFFVKLLTISKHQNNKLEHLTSQSDEAVQNLASLYNKDQLTIAKITATGSITDKSMNTNTIKEYIDAVATSAQKQIDAINARITAIEGREANYASIGTSTFRIKNTSTGNTRQTRTDAYGPYLLAYDTDLGAYFRNKNSPLYPSADFIFKLEQP